jgi:protein TonB
MLRVARVVRAGGGAAPAAPAPVSGDNATPPVLVGFVKPVYPEMARRLREQGDVVVRLQIDAMGRVTGAELVRGVAGNGGIDDAALQAARNARFRPATRDGKPVPATYTLTVPFRL